MNFQLWLEVNELIMPKLFEKVKQLQGEYSGVHFSKMNQISFNLSPSHFDPIGVYVFPKKYILEGGLKANLMFSSYPYAFFIEPTEKAKILNLDMNLSEAENLLEKMGIDKNLLYSKEIYHHSGTTPGHKFWGVLENIRNTKKLSKNFSWNILLSKTGYNTLYDPGLGIIHNNEPFQIVYLDHRAYRILDMLKNTKKHSLIIKLASYFPDFKIRKKKISWSTKEYEFILEKNNIRIYLYTSEHTPNKIKIKIYGFKQDYEKNFNLDSQEDLLKAVIEIKSFLDSSEKTPEFFTAQDYSIINKISYDYKLKINPEYPGVISKKYKNNTKFELKYSPSSQNITLQVESQSLWSRYFYYYSTTATTPEETIKVLFSGIKDKIKEDLNDENSRKKYDAPYAMKFIEFLEKRVFVKRK